MSLFAAACLLFLAWASPGFAQYFQYLTICNNGRVPLFYATYNANPLFSTGTLEGWYSVPSGDCSDILTDDSRWITVAFGASDPEGELVPLRFNVEGVRRRNVRGKMTSLCVPSGRQPFKYTATYSQMQGACPAGETKLMASFGILGGDNDVRVTVGLSQSEFARIAGARSGSAPATPKPAPQASPLSQLEALQGLNTVLREPYEMAQNCVALKRIANVARTSEQKLNWRAWNCSSTQNEWIVENFGKIIAENTTKIHALQRSLGLKVE